MLIATKQLQQEAGNAYVQRYEAMCKPVQDIVIDDFSITADLRESERSAEEARRFYEQRAFITDKNDVIITIVDRDTPKADWKEGEG